MKKLISGVLALGLLGAVANAESGIFAGINVGLPIVSTSVANVEGGFGWTVGVDVGYKFMFNDMFGLRGYVDYYFAQAYGKNNLTLTQNLVAANVDFIYAPIELIDIYVGIGAGYADYSSTTNVPNTNTNTEFSGFNLPINVGVNFNFGASTVSVGGKLPILSVAGFRSWIVKAEYIYTFSF